MAHVGRKGRAGPVGEKQCIKRHGKRNAGWARAAQAMEKAVEVIERQGAKKDIAARLEEV